MGDNGGCHTQAGIGIQVATADKALHQFVGNVIIFRQNLSGSIDRDGFRPIFLNDLLHLVGHQIETALPRTVLAQHGWVEQTVDVIDGFVERGTLDTETAEVRRMLLVARHWR